MHRLTDELWCPRLWICLTQPAVGLLLKLELFSVCSFQSAGGELWGRWCRFTSFEGWNISIYWNWILTLDLELISSSKMQHINFTFIVIILWLGAEVIVERWRYCFYLKRLVIKETLLFNVAFLKPFFFSRSCIWTVLELWLLKKMLRDYISLMPSLHIDKISNAML